MAITASTALAGAHRPLFTKDATDQGYGGVTTATPGSAVKPGSFTPPAQGVAGAQQPVSATNTVGRLPFTGVQLGVFLALGLALFAGGVLLHRAGRGRSRP
jgi:hypothetical protein